MDMSAFAPAPCKDIPEDFGDIFPLADDCLPRDRDGLIISDTWVHVPERWEKLPLSTRKGLSDSYVEHLAKEKEAAAKKLTRKVRPPATRFTTDAAIRWGRKQGWKLIDRENYDFKNKRHRDLQLAMDCLFETPRGLAMVQGAGRHERQEHRTRFDSLGGETKAMRRHIEIYYLEFVRGESDPVVVEKWA